MDAGKKSKSHGTIKGNGNGHCPHHWLITEARAEFSDAVCKLCGEKKKFRNWVPSLEYYSIKEGSCRKGGLSKQNKGEPISYSPFNAAMELKEIRG